MRPRYLRDAMISMRLSVQVTSASGPAGGLQGGHRARADPFYPTAEMHASAAGRACATAKLKPAYTRLPPEVAVGKINLVRVILGGLLAGLVIIVGESTLHLGLLAERMELAYRELNLPPTGRGAAAVFGGLGVIFGVLIVWLYAAVRPRFGPGPKTAVLTAFFVWLFAVLWPTLTSGLIGLFDADLLVFMAIWGLFEILIATLAGAWLYQEAA